MKKQSKERENFLKVPVLDIDTYRCTGCVKIFNFIRHGLYKFFVEIKFSTRAVKCELIRNYNYFNSFKWLIVFMTCARVCECVPVGSVLKESRHETLNVKVKYIFITLFSKLNN